MSGSAPAASASPVRIVVMVNRTAQTIPMRLSSVRQGVDLMTSHAGTGPVCPSTCTVTEPHTALTAPMSWTAMNQLRRRQDPPGSVPRSSSSVRMGSASRACTFVTPSRTVKTARTKMNGTVPGTSASTPSSHAPLGNVWVQRKGVIESLIAMTILMSLDAPKRPPSPPPTPQPHKVMQSGTDCTNLLTCIRHIDSFKELTIMMEPVSHKAKEPLIKDFALPAVDLQGFNQFHQ
ncbi:hypothetical protein GWK47_029993 [Chionoecetes opilio]|uniref:Uncharacterized protein n=1 Tax=Chionoecetes opilio TaxID=41210 RepID=A0A8J5D4X8_CHIOP|nr:hypothetical protein GWK47_029993 [Chionoecetes opilio]